MVRELFEIEATPEGWLVRAQDRAAAACRPTKLQAIEEAHTLAARFHAQTGRPSAVLVPMGSGTSVIVGTCG